MFVLCEYVCVCWCMCKYVCACERLSVYDVRVSLCVCGYVCMCECMFVYVYVILCCIGMFMFIDDNLTSKMLTLSRQEIALRTQIRRRIIIPQLLLLFLLIFRESLS